MFDMWRHVFNTNHRYYLSVQDAADTASRAGYKFFSWNGRIKFIAPEGEVCETGIAVEELGVTNEI